MNETMSYGLAGFIMGTALSGLPVAEKPFCPVDYVGSSLSWWRPQEDISVDGDDWRADEWWTYSCSREQGGGDCDDFAVASATLLKEKGYAPIILYLPEHRARFWLSDDFSLLMSQGGHAVHLIVDEKGYGLTGVNEQDMIAPRYETFFDLLNHWTYSRYIAHETIRFKLIDLSSVDLSRSGNVLDDIRAFETKDFYEIPNPRYEQNERRER